MNDKTQKLFEEINRGLANRCVELAREGRSQEAERLHRLQLKLVAMVIEWRDRGTGMPIAGPEHRPESTKEEGALGYMRDGKETPQVGA